VLTGVRQLRETAVGANPRRPRYDFVTKPVERIEALAIAVAARRGSTASLRGEVRPPGREVVANTRRPRRTLIGGLAGDAAGLRADRSG